MTDPSCGSRVVDHDATLRAFLAKPDRGLLSPACLRLGRRLPAVGQALDPLLDDPLDRALLGLGPAPAESEPLRAVLSAVAVVDGGGTIPDAAQIEALVQGDARCWPLAAQVHAACSVQRERQARMRLSVQELPYVFPGELDPLVVDILAVGARVMPALHVDWARKLTGLAADALVLDCRALGLWFWPVLRSLATPVLVRPLARLKRARRLPAGGLGLAAAYASRVGAPVAPLLADAGPADQLLAALAIIGDRPAP